MLGTFYSSPKPGSPAFVAVGDTVEPDAVVCIVEVMKLMNSVQAGVSGTVTEVYAKDGDLVEFGQPLFAVRESA
jgi:acetyl-CoA carboxylase biotin carboxyl carrier protein